MKFLIIISSIVAAIVLSNGSSVSMHDSFYCFANDPLRVQDSMYASQSSYEASRGRSINSNISSKSLSLILSFFQIIK